MSEQKDAIKDLMQAARLIIAESGVRTFSLRALSARSGWTMGELNYRFGKKQAIITALMKFEANAHIAATQRFLEMASKFDGHDPATIATILCLHLDDLTLNHREAAISWVELLADFAIREETSPIIQSVYDAHYDLWRAFLERSNHARADILAILITEYIGEELPYSIAIGHAPNYRLLRAASARRLAEGVVKGPQSQDMAPLIQQMYAGTATPAPSKNGRAQSIAKAAAQLIPQAGVAAVTHRAVAAAAGVPVSTVAHHFQSGRELLQAALGELFESQWRDVNRYVGTARPMSVDDTSLWSEELADRLRAYNHAARQITLVAIRNPDLRSVVSEIRGKRGQRTARLYARVIDPEIWDQGAVHLLSMLIGGRIFRVASNAYRHHSMDIFHKINNYKSVI